MKLKELMANKGYSFRNLAKESGVALSTIERLIYGEMVNPFPSTMRKIAAVLGQEIREIDEFKAVLETRLKTQATKAAEQERDNGKD